MPATHIRFYVKYLDGKTRQQTVNMGSYTENRNYAQELAETLHRFLYNGNIFGYTVEVVTTTRNGEYTSIIGKDEI